MSNYLEAEIADDPFDALEAHLGNSCPEAKA